MSPKTPAQTTKGPVADTSKQVTNQARQVKKSAQNIEASAGAAADSADQQLLSAQRRTVLAANRTSLAAERTYSAWVRTGMAGLAGGIAARPLLEGRWAHWVVLLTATTLLLFSIFCFVAGVWRELQTDREPPEPQLRRLPAAALVIANLALGLASLAALVEVWLAGR